MKGILEKKSKPCLVIKPKLELGNHEFFEVLPDWIDTNHYVYKDRRNYLPVFCDDYNKIYMYASGDRIKLSFEIEIILDSKLQQINTAYYLKGSILHKGYFYLNHTRMESEIPKYFIAQIASIMNFDLTTEEGRGDFNNYLNENSQHFIEEKIKLSSGNFNHFFLFSANLLSKFNDYPQMDDGTQEDMATTNFKVSENFDIEFWSPLNFFLEVGKKFSKIPPKDYPWLIQDGLHKVQLHYTLTFPIPDKIGNFVYVNKIMYLTDDDEMKDEVDLHPLFDTRDFKIISHEVVNGKRIEDFFRINLYLDNFQLERSAYIIDWEKFKLTNIRPMPNQAYTLVLYKHPARYNKIEHSIDLEDNWKYN